MKGCSLILLTLLFASSQAFAQKEGKYLHLRSGKIAIATDASLVKIDSINKKAIEGKKSFVVIQFDNIPSEGTKRELAAEGIELISYVADNAYTAVVKKVIRKELLFKSKAKGLYQLLPQHKMDASLASGLFPAHAIKIAGTVDVMLRITKSFSVEEVLKTLADLKIDVISKNWIEYNVVDTRITPQQLFYLADQPFVEFVSPIAPPDQPLNENSRILSGATILNASIGDGGKGLNGEGVVIGIGDNADVQLNVDFAGRLINRTVAPPDNHGTHVSGTAAGAGVVNELYRGYLPKATIISHFFQSILIQSPTYVNDYGMVLTNNSYGGLLGCENNGVYDQTSAILDQQLIDMPNLQHVFAAGNSGGLTCGAYPLGFRTVLGSYQSAKNVLTVGNTTLDGVIAGGSSRGPVRDGRIKPEVTAMGTSVRSTWPFNTYANISGTSMASPAVSGGAGLLYQRYRQLYGNANPKGALIKALICNGAADKGNPGPDFRYGFGSMNLMRSVDMLENSRFFTGNIPVGGTQTHGITVPANTAALKVMLYWHDPAASVLATKALVNDLDLEVVDPSASTVLPLVLDSTATGVNNNAVNGVDRTNNIEQVVINNPTAGTYTLTVKGTAITQNPSQEYFVVYDAIPNSIQLTSPAGGSAFAPGETLRISWDAYGDVSSTFALEYSSDGGVSWNLIASGITAGTQFYSVTVPAIVTDNAMIRVIKVATGQMSTSGVFTVIGVPTVTLSPVQCEGYITANWSAISGAADYEVMLLRGTEMKSIATTTATTYTFSGLSSDTTYWVTVRARVNGKSGRRASAIFRQPNNGSCASALWDNDLKLKAILSPVNGRKFTSTGLTNAATVSIEIKNLDDAAASGFTAAYSIDGGSTWVTENVTATIAAGAIHTHNFTTTADLSSVGIYNIVAAVTNNLADPAKSNDTLSATIKHLDNQALNLTTAFVDDIETAADSTYSSRNIGLAGLDRYDFENGTAIGRLRTFVNTGLANSGSKALTMDVRARSNTHNVNYLYGTYNLSGYNAVTNELRLDLQFNMHGLNLADSNKIWIRGDDTKPWIKVYDLGANQNDYATYKRTHSIEIADSLVKYGQSFSSSFQMRWGQNGYYQTVDRGNAGGVSIDDIRLYQAVNDAQLVSIDTPYNYSCGLSNAFALKITVRNGVKTNFTNVPVRYSINGGAWISENIPALTSESSVQYSFATPADLSEHRLYTIKAIVDYPGDNIHDNDTATIYINNVPVISSFPYVQNFETDNAGWFSEGLRNSWEYGTPNSVKINRAASGSKAWKTRLSGNYNDEETSYLNSPCFDLSGMTNPTLSFHVALDLENCGATACDAAWVEYSPDGISWTPLFNAGGTATNWYNSPGNFYWSIENYTRWHVATVALPTGFNRMRFRIGFSSDQAVNREGIAIDDIHVYDNTQGIYTGAATATPVTTTITGGTSWINFQKDGQLIASLQPNNQALGSTDVDVYFNSGAARHTTNRYYGNRSITIKPATTSLADSTTVRFYFLDTEAEALIYATGCSSCLKPASVPEFGVSQYDDNTAAIENGTIGDNVSGAWTFHPATKAVKVPFDKGYYVEFKVKDFSEFWLSNGSLSNTIILPVRLINFGVNKSGDDAVIEWTVAEESGVDRYEIEVARSAEHLQNNNFEKIGEIAGRETTTEFKYNFIDKEEFKAGIRYYRLKTINADGSYSYTSIKSVAFSNANLWSVLPNPSSGKFYFVYQLNSNEIINLHLTDAAGRMIKKYTVVGNGDVNKQALDISGKQYAPGIYFLHTYKDGKQESFKVYKQ